MEGKMWQRVKKQQGYLQLWEDCRAKPVQEHGGDSQGMDWRWSQSIKRHHTDESGL